MLLTKRNFLEVFCFLNLQKIYLLICFKLIFLINPHWKVLNKICFKMYIDAEFFLTKPKQLFPKQSKKKHCLLLLDVGSNGLEMRNNSLYEVSKYLWLLMITTQKEGGKAGSSTPLTTRDWPVKNLLSCCSLNSRFSLP